MSDYRYLVCPAGQDPAQFTAWVTRLAPGDPVQRDTSTRAYVLRVGAATYAAWKAAQPRPAATPLAPGETAAAGEQGETGNTAPAAPTATVDPPAAPVASPAGDGDKRTTDTPTGSFADAGVTADAVTGEPEAAATPRKTTKRGNRKRGA